jgi:hypothetical protein
VGVLPLDASQVEQNRAREDLATWTEGASQCIWQLGQQARNIYPVLSAKLTNMSSAAKIIKPNYKVEASRYTTALPISQLELVKDATAGASRRSRNGIATAPSIAKTAGIDLGEL